MSKEEIYTEGLKTRIAALNQSRTAAAPCAICGRLLTHPKSAENGIGPVCRGKGIVAVSTTDLQPVEVE